MHRMAVLFALVLLTADGHAATTWRGTSAHAVTRGTGDVLDDDGAAVTFSAESTGEKTFVGAGTSLDARAFQGKEVRLAGNLHVIEGSGDAALWVRADGPDGVLAFANSGDRPVRQGGGPMARDIFLYIPSSTLYLRFGVTLASAGRVDTEHLTLTSAPPKASGVSAHDMVAHALPIIRDNALNAGNVDWPAEEAALLMPDLKGLPAQEANGRIQRMLNALADRHSTLKPPRAVLANRENAIASQPIESRQMRDIGYVLLPGLRGRDARATAAFTAELCKRVTTLAPASSRGWILDLRKNTGGNMWPMLNGLHSLLGANDAGAFRKRDGEMTHWRSRATAQCGLDLSDRPVAVLVGPKTASSGEAVAVAFKARPETRFFGQTTAGLATANVSYPLPDGSALVLTTAEMLDREGVAYPQGVTPERVVPGEQDAIDAAVAWLSSMEE